MSYEQELRKQLEDVKAKARAIIESTEDRSDEAQANLDGYLRDGEKIAARIVEVKRQAALQSAGDTLDGLIHGAADRDHNRSHPTEPGSVGDLFIRSDVFQNYSGRGTSSRLWIEERALPMSIGSVGAGIPKPQQIQLGNVEGPAPLLGLIPTIQVSTNSIETIVWNKVAGGAAVVPERSAKPSAEWAPTATPTTLDTIAVTTAMTRQLMEDAPAVRSMIDTELQREVSRKLEAEAAAALVDATLPAVTGSTLLAGIRVGIGTVQAAGFDPDAVLLNPADWADLDVGLVTSTLDGPIVRQSFWGLRPVASVAQPAGTATVGDFAAGAARYSRSGINLYITDSHAMTFIENVFTLLAETRSKTVIQRPAAFAEATATP